MRRPLATVLAVALLVAACGDDESGADNGHAQQPTDTTSSSSDSSLPGERQEIYPYPGARLAVAGVAAADTLEVRSGPGTEFGVVL